MTKNVGDRIFRWINQQLRWLFAVWANGKKVAILQENVLELYSRKLDGEEYDEALALARAYGLDCDLVYQRQWEKAPATFSAINDYLSKVTKRNWVLRECLERVPTSVNSARELLILGLKLTDLEAIAKVDGTFLNTWMSSPQEYEETNTEILERMKMRRHQLLAQINFDNLTLQQKKIISIRRRLLQYLDRLTIYQKILFECDGAYQHFDPSFFETFRTQSAIDTTAGFARREEWQAVSVMFTFYGSSTLPHRLAICSCFPETMSPRKYRSVLPSCDFDGKVLLWRQRELRKPDWCEYPAVRVAVDVDQLLEVNAVESFYNKERNLRPFRSTDIWLTTATISDWYQMRGADIEKQSTIVENALDFIKLGLERNVPNLKQIHHQLLTLETLVYDLQFTQLSLEQLGAMSELRVCQTIMSDCDANSFLPKLRRWLMPYLRRLDTVQPGRMNELFRGLLIARSQENLDWAISFCTDSRTSKLIITDPYLVSVALDCIYPGQNADEIEMALLSGQRTAFNLRLKKRLNQLNSHREAINILKKI